MEAKKPDTVRWGAMGDETLLNHYEENIERLERELEELHAQYRIRQPYTIKPEPPKAAERQTADVAVMTRERPENEKDWNDKD